MNTDKHSHNKIKICVSGAAEMGFLPPEDYERAKELGREVVRHGASLLTGATTGFPLWVAMGAKEEGGISIGFSPAETEEKHVHEFKLPIDYLDLIIYTGFGYIARDMLLTRASDAVIIGPGRIGTIHEFTVAYEDNKPIGILRGDWDTDEVIKFIMEKSHRTNDKVVFGDTPKEVVEKVLEMVKKEKEKDKEI
ncbi:MAG: hypothetical protein WC629_01465 [Candidatus Paceibacterota bacterium]|jgi:hypothetical protein